MKDTVFIHTNPQQIVGALVSQYSMHRASRYNERFDVRIIRTEDHPFLAAREGQKFLREGLQREWRMDDLQSFTPLRFLPPELMGYRGRAVVVDPDVFAIGDVYELLARDMQGKSLMCRARSGAKTFASSVMLLDCAKLGHWQCERQFAEMFGGKRDYMEWISLKLEPRETIGIFEPEWNSFDELTPSTKLLHNTRRRTQPWKTGLKVDWTPSSKPGGPAARGWIRRARERLFGRYGALGRYRRHPDPNQERFFFGLLRECLDAGVVSEEMLREEIRREHVRRDAFDVMARSGPTAAVAQLSR